MGHLIFILVSLALLGGFFAFTGYEARRGARMFADHRARLDRDVERIEFVLAHIDFVAFVRTEMRHITHRIGHEAVHLSLQMVRAMERLLTRLVRHFHMRQAVDTAPRENVRKFVKTLSDFKGRLETKRPEVPEL